MHNTGYFELAIDIVYSCRAFICAFTHDDITVQTDRRKRGNMTVARSRPIRRQLYHFEQFQKYNIVIQELKSVWIDILYDLMRF